MKKLVSFDDLATKQHVKAIPMDSSDVKEFNLFMKQVARESSKNSQKANTTASKVYLTR